MNKKFSLGITISLMAIACAITFVLTVTVSTNMFNEKIAGVSEREEIYTKIQEIDTYVRNSSLYSIDNENLLNSIVKGYVSGLSDNDAYYLTADEYYKYQQVEKGVIIGAGIEAEREESGYLKISYIYPGSPAEEENIAVGDIITSINGKNVLEIGAENAVKLLDGDENTKLEMTIQQSGEEIPVYISRQSFTVRSVSHYIVNNYGYIRIECINALTGTQFTSAIQMLQSQGATSLVIDVRGVSGSYAPLQEMLEPFISPRSIANVEYYDGTVKKLLETTESTKLNLPVVVMIDKETSGAAELFASSMRDYSNVKLVGSQTEGTDTMTVAKSFSDGSALVLTTAKVIPLTQDSYSGGLKPDYAVDLADATRDTSPDSTESADPQLKKAFEVIEGLK